MILIAGDSWACGEWGGTDSAYTVTHGGLAQYLREDNCSAIHLGKPNGYNAETAARITNFLDYNPDYPAQIKYIIVFQTGWDRDIPFVNSNSLRSYFESGYSVGKHILIESFYQKLSDISVKYNIPVYLIGGCSDALYLENFSKDYPGVQLVAQSLTNLLLNDQPLTKDPCYGFFRLPETVERIKKVIPNQDIAALIDDIQLGQDRIKTWSTNKKFFWPDGVHPNREGHQLLYKFLKKQNIV